MAPSSDQTPPLDDLDRRMVTALVADARMSMRALAEELHISRATAYARLERLQKAGVLTGFSATVDPERAGLRTSAYVALSICQDAWREIAAGLRSIRFVEQFSLMAADFDVLVLVRAPDNTTLREVVLEEIQNVPGVRSTRTWLIFADEDGPGAWPR